MKIATLLFTYRLASPNLLLIVAAVVPALVLLVYVYRKDRIEKEPNRLLARLLLWGIVSTFLAVVSESVGAAALAFFLPGGEENPAYGLDVLRGRRAVGGGLQVSRAALAHLELGALQLPL